MMHTGAGIFFIVSAIILFLLYHIVHVHMMKRMKNLEERSLHIIGLNTKNLYLLEKSVFVV